MHNSQVKEKVKTSSKPKNGFFALFPYFFVYFLKRSPLCSAKMTSKSEKIIKKSMIFV